MGVIWKMKKNNKNQFEKNQSLQKIFFEKTRKKILEKGKKKTNWAFFKGFKIGFTQKN
ncbi:MAG: hypothetical protein CM15mP12_4420 [Gammaproteobacteria bacterium]|nr:MAG: hypothetical protein CM15mP12_4420 [Gammaproteobacteria bacterium]